MLGRIMHTLPNDTRYFSSTHVNQNTCTRLWLQCLVTLGLCTFSP